MKKKYKVKGNRQFKWKLYNQIRLNKNDYMGNWELLIFDIQNG